MPNHDFDTLIKGEQYRQFLQQNPQPELPANIEFYKRDEISSDKGHEWINSLNLPHAVYNEFRSETFYALQLGIGYATGNGPSGIMHRFYDLENDPQE